MCGWQREGARRVGCGEVRVDWGRGWDGGGLFSCCDGLEGLMEVMVEEVRVRVEGWAVPGRMALVMLLISGDV